MAQYAFERRNFRAGVFHGALFEMATTFAEPFALLPVFLKEFTASNLLVGVAVALVHAGRVIPELPVARWIRMRPHLGRRLMLVGIWTRFAAWGCIAALTLFSPVRDTAMLVLIILLLGVYSIGAGVASLPINQVFSETIRPTRRSSLFGMRLFLGGILSLAAGAIVAWVMGSADPNPATDYGLLFLLSFLVLGVAYTGASMLRFPDGGPGLRPQDARSIPTEVRHALRRYPMVSQLVAVEILAGGLTLLLPFLAIYGTEVLGFAMSWIGVFIIVHKAGAIAGNLVWIPLGNRKGTRGVIVLGIACGLLGAVAVWSLHTPAGFALAFVLLGLARSGTVVGFSGYILELGEAQVRPVLIAIKDTLLLPVYFAPALGGLLADRLGYASLAVVSTLLLSGALCAAWRLCEPRTSDVRCGPYEARLDD
jgi:MFS family permease